MKSDAQYTDIHCHGGGGYSFDDVVFGASRGDDEAVRQFETILRTHSENGTAQMLVSLITAPLDLMCQRIQAVGVLMKTHPEVLGVHLEGPFLSLQKKGAHNPKHLLEPTAENVQKLVDAGKVSGNQTIRQVTIAPELPHALDAIKVLAAEKIVPAIGHTAADYDAARRGFEAGATHMTHTFNAMCGIQGRLPGPVLAAIECGATLELICDGIHISPAIIRMLYKICPDKIVLVTDAMAAAGAADGEYMLGDLAVTVQSGKAMLAGMDTIAGSTLTMDAAVENVVAYGVDREVAKRSATRSAKMMSLLQI